ncbi:MAG: hypothetical protein NTU61_02430, partial [Candidatus Altiarchaeota archaeon]|nr:hypothetical protein [Candidatus Altiarchaeota archaeon]
ERRIVECSEGRFKPKTDDDLSCRLTILSYPVARMIAGSIGSKAVMEKYAAGEAECAVKLLSTGGKEVKDEIIRGLDLGYENDAMELAKYVSLSSELAKRAPKWKLLNRVVESGMVQVTVDEVVTLSREAIKEEVKKPVNVKNIPDELKKRAKNLRTILTPEMQNIKIERVEDQALPPCVKAMLTLLEQGAASHNSMFTLATFFTNMGLSVEDTVNVFRKSPKFSEETTRYQIEFLSGQKSNTEYTCPTCATIKGWGLCKWDCPVKHPIQYYRQHAKGTLKLIKSQGK